MKNNPNRQGLTIPEESPRGVLWSGQFQNSPTPDGSFLSIPLHLPEFDVACYYAPFQKHAIDPSLDLWPEGYNQCHPLPIRDLRNAKRGGFFLILRLADHSGYLSLVPMVCENSMAWLRGDGNGLRIEAGHWGTSPIQANIPLIAFARDTNVYHACRLAWREALRVFPNATPREEKTFPEIFQYLGWCSWEEFKMEINANVLSDALDRLSASDVPIRWILVDDGHLQHTGGKVAAATDEGEVPQGQAPKKLRGFGVDEKKFPTGWQPVFNAVQRNPKIRWTGVWLNFNGYWDGIDPAGDFGPLRETLVEVSPGIMQPSDQPGAADRFFDEWIARQKTAGFDFVKVDNQAKNVTFYRGHVANAVRATLQNHRALELAVKKHLQAMINCMAHNNLCAFSTIHSQITRCSEDYKRGDLWRAKHHLHNSFGNMLWLGQTVWGDHDMFHSSDPVAAAVMARSKAISGGPVYLSDAPEKIDARLARTLCLHDGRILRPLEPTLPLPDSIFTDPYEDEKAWCVAAPLQNGCAALAAYNLTHPEKPVSACLTLSDFSQALGQNFCGQLAYEPATRTTTRLDQQALTFQIPTFGDRFWLLCPVQLGWAVIGLEEKILSPAAVEDISFSPNTLELTLVESGPLIVYSDFSATLSTEKYGSESLGGGLWRINIPEAAQPTRVKITR